MTSFREEITDAETEPGEPSSGASSADVAVIALESSHRDPRRFSLDHDLGMSVLALGAENDSTYCYCNGRDVELSDRLGRLTTPDAYRRLVDAVRAAMRAPNGPVDLIAHDLHPQYMTTQLARSLGAPCIAVQHHHAHLASVMADRGISTPVVGVCCDGVGYGADGAAWGCEIMRCTRERYERVGRLDYFPLIGGDRAALENWRPAAALLHAAFGDDWLKRRTASFERVDDATIQLTDAVLRRRAAGAGPVNAPDCSSLGRVFDGVSFLLGLCERNDRPAAAAIALEAAAGDAPVDPYAYGVNMDGGAIRMSLAPTIRAIVRDLQCGNAVGTIAGRFHETLASMLVTAARTACERFDLTTVVISGGCFANRRLREGVVSRLENLQLRALLPRRVSVSDAGLSLGQAVIAAARYREADPCA